MADDRGGNLASCSSNNAFSDWVKQNGGDQSLIEFLFQHGFTSKLSLKYLNLECEDGQSLLSQLSLGQRCLLFGLVNLCTQEEATGLPPSESSSSTAMCSASASQAYSIASKGRTGKESIKAKINRLFNFNNVGAGPTESSLKRGRPRGDSSDSDSADFSPTPQFNHPHPARKRVGKGKGKLSGGDLNKGGGRSGTAVKRKIKEVRFRVVWVYPGTTTTPLNRSNRTKEVWIRADASADDVCQRIREEMIWPDNQEFEYMYARGKSLRVAKLADIENAVDWDCETVKALMGSGYLYVSRSPVYEDEKDTTMVNRQMLTLKQMFPEKGEDELQLVLDVYGMSDDGVEVLLTDNTELGSGRKILPAGDLEVDFSIGQGSSSSDPIILDDVCTCTGSTGREIVMAHSKHMVGASEYTLITDRTSCDSMWLTMLSFYKKAMKDPSLLSKQLVIQFTGECGADTGALRREFFEDCIKEMNTRLFDGDNTSRVPKKDWSFEMLFEICGMLVAHSVLQSGPGLPCLSTSVYLYLVSGDPAYCFPTKSDIPLDLGTHSLISFINKVEETKSNEDLEVIIDEPENLAIINGSSWNIVDPVTITNKHFLIQRLIEEEVIVKRERNLKAFRRGLQAMEFLSLLVKFPSLMQPFFVVESKPLCPDDFLALAETPTPKNQLEAQAWIYFKEFVSFLQNQDKINLNSLLRFITGLSSVPPMGLENKISIGFIEEVFPKAQACFCKISLPVIHSSFEEFHKAFMTALELGGGYGNI